MNKVKGNTVVNTIQVPTAEATGYQRYINAGNQDTSGGMLSFDTPPWVPAELMEKGLRGDDLENPLNHMISLEFVKFADNSYYFDPDFDVEESMTKYRELYEDEDLEENLNALIGYYGQYSMNYLEHEVILKATWFIPYGSMTNELICRYFKPSHDYYNAPEQHVITEVNGGILITMFVDSYTDFNDSQVMIIPKDFEDPFYNLEEKDEDEYDLHVSSEFYLEVVEDADSSESLQENLLELMNYSEGSLHSLTGTNGKEYFIAHLVHED